MSVLVRHSQVASRRLPPRTLTDALVEALLDAFIADTWEYVEDVQARLNWSTSRMRRTRVYLTHRYGAIRFLPACGAMRLLPEGLERYLAQDRLPLACTCCAGENEEAP